MGKDKTMQGGGNDPILQPHLALPHPIAIPSRVLDGWEQRDEKRIRIRDVRCW